jgi:hypothetical protein
MDKFDDCLDASYWSFKDSEWIEKSVPPLLGRKPDVTRHEQIVNYAEPAKGKEDHEPWAGLPSSMAENFAAQWYGYLDIHTQGEYTFTVESEHLGRLTVDDTRIIDISAETRIKDEKPTPDGVFDLSGKLYLFSGARAVNLQYVYKSGGNKSCVLYYKGPDTDGEKRVIPAAVLQHQGTKNKPVLKPGVLAEYFQSEDPSGGFVDLIRVEKQLDFAGEDGKPTMEPWENLPRRYGGGKPWSARFTCYLNLSCGDAKEATYTFHVVSGGKAVVYLNQAEFMTTDEPKEAKLPKGEHLFEIYYRADGKGGNQLQFYFAGPETSPGLDEEKNPLPGVEQLVPSTVTRHYVKPTACLPKGNPVQVCEGKTSVISADWGYDDSCVVTCDEDGDIKVFKATDCSPMSDSMKCREQAACAKIGKKSLVYAVGLENGSIMIWDLTTQEQAGDTLTGHEGTVNAVAFNHDDTVLASVGQDGTVRLWDVKNQTELTDPENPLIAYKHIDVKKDKDGHPPSGFASEMKVKLRTVFICR